MRTTPPALFLALCATAILGCPKDRPGENKSPAPSASSAPAADACAKGGAEIQDPSVAAFFPRKIGGYCVDPNGETRVFGEGGNKALDKICTEAVDGECEVYKGFGLRSMTTFRYVDSKSSTGSVEVFVSKYANAEGAYGMFTKRVVGDNDPADTKAPKELGLAGSSAQGTGSTYLWKGSLFVELTYSNESETPKQLADSAAKLLGQIAKEIAAKMPGAAALPDSATALPKEKRLPLGVLFEHKDAMGVSGAGAGAWGYYKDGDKRYRVLSITRSDADQAKDVMQSIGKRQGAAKEKDIGEGAVRLMLGEAKDGPRAEWVVARVGKQVLGVGDEPLVIKDGMAAADREKVGLSKDQKIALLKSLLAGIK